MTCKHSNQITPNVMAKTLGCEECEKSGQLWVSLRVCLTCGHVGCCNSSIGKHAQQHAKDTNHPIVQSKEPGETWVYCYVDQDYLDDDGKKKYTQPKA